jgi:GTPase Era involved in 16S rRNA processing
MGNCFSESSPITEIFSYNSISTKLKNYSKNNRIIVVGNINSGKSSLLNKLIGTDLLPVDAKRETLIPLSISHNTIIKVPRLEFIIDKRFQFPVDMFVLKSETIIGDKIMYYTEDIEQLQPILSSLNKIYRIVEGKNYNDIKINIHMCIDNLKNMGIDNLLLMDTPGYNESGQQSYIQTCIKDALSNSSTVFYVLDYCSISSSDNTRMYNEIKKYNGNIFYIVNKIDIPLEKYKKSTSSYSSKIDIIKSTIIREMRLLDDNFNVKNMVLTHRDDLRELFNLIKTNKSLKITKSFISNLVRDLIFAEMVKDKYRFIAGKKHYHAILKYKGVDVKTIVPKSSIKQFIKDYDFANKEMNYFVDIILALEDLEFCYSNLIDVDYDSFNEFKTMLSKDVLYSGSGDSNWKFYEGGFDQLYFSGKGKTFYKDGTVFVDGEFSKGILLINKPFALYLPNGKQIVKDGVLIGNEIVIDKTDDNSFVEVVIGV